jgi:dynein heavy chain
MSGEIIAMSPVMNLLFEPMDLAVASPATVSRCGMVYMEPTSLGWEPLLDSWLEQLPCEKSQQASLRELFMWFIDPCLWYLRRECKSPVPTTDIMLARAVMRLIQSHMDIWIEVPDEPSKAPETKKGIEILQGVFIFSLIWGVGATVDAAGRAKFDPFLRQLLKKEVPEILTQVPGASQPVFPSTKITKGPPEKGTLYDYVFSLEKGYSWIEWMSTVPAYTVPKGATFQDIFVSTEDTVQAGYLVDVLATHNVPVIVSGNTGTGKTILVRDRMLNSLDREIYQNIFLNFSAQTSARVSQSIIDGQLDKRRKGVYGPPFGKKTVIFVDDLNMPALETYGAQPPIELLRQWMDHSGWYDLKDCTFRELVDIQFIAAMGAPGGGRNPITPRYIRHFNLLWMTDYAPQSLERIFQTIFSWHFNDQFPSECTGLCKQIVASTIKVFNTVGAELLPTPSKSHYTFNLRDLSKVFQGMTSGSTKNVLAANDLLRLWVHECLRVFSDRLVEQKDTDWFHALMCEQLGAGFKKDWNSVTGTDEKRLLYGDFMGEQASYEQLADMNLLIERVSVQLEDFNAVSKTPMELVLFPFAVEHVCRVLRIIKQPFGNALLVGVGGSGRQSLTTLACHIAQYEIFRIELSKNYDMAAWREDLKKVLRMAGEVSSAWPPVPTHPPLRFFGLF